MLARANARELRREMKRNPARILHLCALNYTLNSLMVTSGDVKKQRSRKRVRVRWGYRRMPAERTRARKMRENAPLLAAPRGSKDRAKITAIFAVFSVPHRITERIIVPASRGNLRRFFLR